MNATINGTSLAYEDSGHGPAVVLIHDLPLCRKMWEGQISCLSEAGYRIIAPDLRGFGDSPLSVDSPTLSIHADDVIGLLNYLGIGRAMVGGIGFGGFVVRDLLERYPRRLVATGMFATCSGLQGEEEREMRVELSDMMREGRSEMAITSLLSLMCGIGGKRLGGEVTRDILSWMVNTPIRTLQDGLHAAAGGGGNALSVSGAELPTLVVSGEHDLISPPEQGKLLASRLNRSTYRLIAGAGHLVNMERREEFNRYLLDFLKELEIGIQLPKVA